MRDFYIRLQDGNGSAIATSIQVQVQRDIPLKMGGVAHPLAIQHVVGIVATELARYAAGEALMAGPDEDEEFKRRTGK